MTNETQTAIPRNRIIGDIGDTTSVGSHWTTSPILILRGDRYVLQTRIFVNHGLQARPLQYFEVLRFMLVHAQPFAQAYFNTSSTSPYPIAEMHVCSFQEHQFIIAQFDTSSSACNVVIVIC